MFVPGTFGQHRDARGTSGQHRCVGHGVYTGLAGFAALVGVLFQEPIPAHVLQVWLPLPRLGNTCTPGLCLFARGVVVLGLSGRTAVRSIVFLLASVRGVVPGLLRILFGLG